MPDSDATDFLSCIIPAATNDGEFTDVFDAYGSCLLYTSDAADEL